MKKDIATKWAAALRSGDYKQGRMVLRTRADEYCCLGVLCDLYEKQCAIKLWEPIDGPIKDIYGFGSSEEYAILPKSVEHWAGMSSDEGDGVLSDGIMKTLTQLNDDGMPFSEIADTIEKHYQTL